MKKIIISAFILCLAFTLSGCSLKQTKGAAKQPEETTKDTSVKPEQEDKNVFTSIKDAMTKQIGLKCKYVDEKGVSATTYIKGNKVYVESEIDVDEVKTTFKGILKDNKYYLWGSNSNEGMVFDIKAMSDNADTSETGPKVETQEDIINKLEANKNSCKPENIAESKFDTPTDIKFVEWSWTK